MKFMENQLIEVSDKSQVYGTSNLLYKEEVYAIIGCCLEVHKELGHGFNEIVYKDALSHELALNEIPFEREKQYEITYKNKVLPRKYVCDFLVDNKVILEIKAQSLFSDANEGQLLNDLAASKIRPGLLINFGEKSLKFKRIIL
jgi:GxxExxY protein